MPIPHLATDAHYKAILNGTEYTPQSKASHLFSFDGAQPNVPKRRKCCPKRKSAKAKDAIVHDDSSSKDSNVSDGSDDGDKNSESDSSSGASSSSSSSSTGPGSEADTNWIQPP